MPKQMFQRPAPISHSKIGKGGKGSPFGEDWGRKKGKKKPPKAAEAKAEPKSPKSK